MAYLTPELLLVGSAHSLVLGSCDNKGDRPFENVVSVEEDSGAEPGYDLSIIP